MRSFVPAEDAAVVKQERFGEAWTRLWFGNGEIPRRSLPNFLFNLSALVVSTMTVKIAARTE